NRVGGNAVALAGSDVTVGTWSTAARTFTPGGTTPNAVRVIGRRDGSSAGGLSFASVLGFSEPDLATQTIAGRLTTTVAAPEEPDPFHGYGLFGRTSLNF